MQFPKKASTRDFKFRYSLRIALFVYMLSQYFKLSILTWNQHVGEPAEDVRYKRLLVTLSIEIEKNIYQKRKMLWMSETALFHLRSAAKL